MTNGFIQYPTTFKSTTIPPDGRNWELLEPLVYQCKDGRLIRASVGSQTDGISTPQVIWNLIAPMGPLWCSGVIHDAGYRETCEIQINGEWQPYLADEHAFDLIIDEALESQGATWLERETIYKALCLAGGRAFAEDRANISTPQVTQ